MTTHTSTQPARPFGWRFVAWLAIAISPTASGAVLYSQTFTSGFVNAGTIQDGSLGGWQDTRSITGTGIAQITGVQVSLDITGGYNGDLYAYLLHDTGNAILLNRVGVGEAAGDPFGYDDPGMQVTLASGGAFPNIHWYGGGGIPTGTYQPDGRAIDPLSEPADFDSASTSTNLDAFNGLDPHGNWTLFIADVSFGGGTSVVSGWGLGLAGAAISVPEPSAAAWTCGMSLLALIALRTSQQLRARPRSA